MLAPIRNKVAKEKLSFKNIYLSLVETFFTIGNITVLGPIYINIFSITSDFSLGFKNNKMLKITKVTKSLLPPWNYHKEKVSHQYVFFCASSIPEYSIK